MFPGDWPENCPPIQAEDCNGDYFHILIQNPPGETDLTSFHEKGRKLQSQLPCVCMPYGLSVFTDRHDALHMQRVYPRLGNWIATLSLTTTDGKMMLTPGQRPTHHTWWPSLECVRRDRVTHAIQVD